MEPHIKKYFSQVSETQSGGEHYQVVVLHDTPDVSWEDIEETVPTMPRGWYELSRLTQEDRVEFTRDYWISKLPYNPDSVKWFTKFFDRVEDIGVVVAEKHAGEPHIPHMIYALRDSSGFYHGQAPMTEKERETLYTLFPAVIFPQDYLSFLEIHNGFSKTTDTGVVSTKIFPEVVKRFCAFMKEDHPPLTTKGGSVNPHSLIPFYESFGMPYYQCFWQDWYPENEMGNVYYSGSLHTISDPVDKVLCEEQMAFPTFLDWLFFYLENVD